MMRPDTFPCQAWYVTDYGVHETTLIRWYGRQNFCFCCEGKTKKKVLDATEAFESPEKALWNAMNNLNTERASLQRLLAKCADRESALLKLQAEITQKNTPKV